MPNFIIRCVAVKVKTESKCCPGSAKCKEGETYIIGPRTPDPPMCGRAFHSIHPMALAMRYTKKMVFESKEGVNVTCPDGYVQYNLKRLRDK